MKDYLRLLKFLKGHERVFAVAVLTMFVASFFEVFQLSLLAPMTDRIFTRKKIIIPNEVPQFVQNIINKFNDSDPAQILGWILTGFVVMLIIKNVLTFAYQYLMGEVAQRIMRDIRYQLYETIQNLSLDYFSKKRTGELISRITHDVNLVENAVSYGITDLFRQTFMIILWICVAFSIDMRSAAVVFFLFPLIGFPMAQIGRKLHKIALGTQEKMADINTLLLETISGVQVVKAFSTEKYETMRFKAKNHDYYKLRMKSIKRLILIPPITDILGGISGILMILWFSKRLMADEMSFGFFVLFFASIMSIISPIKKLGNVNAITQQALSATTRIYEILDTKPSVQEKPQGVVLSELKNSIRFQNIHFRYDKENDEVIKGIDLEIKKGDLVAIVGPTGTGKTTLVNLIPRFYDPTSGSITFDGQDIKNATFESLRKQIGIVTQETILFNDTVKINVAYGRRNASQTEIEEASQRAFAHQFIVKMPQGYETMIGDRGFRLSGGEKQRMSIARAILKNPPILILDEATSQLDSESEKYVQEALDKLMEGRTVIAIAHRLSTIKKADKIVVLENGKIVGLGKHEELLGTCALYQKLHQMQFHT
jgi:subfamily B ATP-binding cassette protein MsbA